MLLQTNICLSQKARCWETAQQEVLTSEDYLKDKECVKKTLRWLCTTPLGVEVQQRSYANAYVMEWIAGTPMFTLELETKYLLFIDEHPELLYSFIHGMASYKLEHVDEKNPVKLYSEGFKIVASLASQSKELSKSSVLKPLLKAARKKTIREYTQTVLSQN
jgi:hypothetical protein